MTLYVVIGPPTSGKTTWVQGRARAQDIVIDYDLLAVALAGPGGDGHRHAADVKTVTKAARTAALNTAIPLARRTDVYLIHSNPPAQQVAWYRDNGAQVITIDPGRSVVRGRVKTERDRLMLKVIDEWYETHPTSGAPPPPSTGKTSRAW